MNDDTRGEMGTAAPSEGAPPAPSAEPTEPEAPTATTSAEGTDPPSGSRPEKRGPMPLDQHEAILRRTRSRYEDTLNRLAWAREYSPDQVATWRQQAEALERSQREPARPQPNLQTEDGRLLYDAEQAEALAEWKVRTALAERDRALEQRLGPLESQTREMQAWSRAGQAMEPYLDQPWFREHVDAITETIAEAQAQGYAMSLEQAIVHVVLPKLMTNRDALSQRLRKEILADLDHTSTQAADTVNPGRRPAARSKTWDEMDLGEALEFELKRRKLV